MAKIDKKTNHLLTITVISGVMFWLINVFIYFLLKYPEDFNFYIIVKDDVEWKLVSLIYVFYILISIIYSLMFFINQLFINKFYTSLISLNIIGIIFVLTIGINRFVINKKDFERVLIKFRKDAVTDIKNDNVKYFSQGLLLPSRTESEKLIKNDIKKILKNYGLNHRSLGCTVMPQVTKAKNEYIRITDIYLNKRNGNGWRIKMKKQIDSIYTRKHPKL